MYAIVDIAGQQFKVEKGQEIFVHRLKGDEGTNVEFNEVLLIDNDGKVDIGTPVINGAQVKATVVEHLKGDKVLVFKKKNRKGYQKLNGHRQYLSLIKIEDIIASGAKRKEAEKGQKPAAVKKEAEKTAAAVKEDAEIAAETKVEKAAPKKEAIPEAKKGTEKAAPAVEETVAEKPSAPEVKELKEAPEATAEIETATVEKKETAEEKPAASQKPGKVAAAKKEAEEVAGTPEKVTEETEDMTILAESKAETAAKAEDEDIAAEEAPGDAPEAGEEKEPKA